jgi:uncharacterized lipoprotein
MLNVNGAGGVDETVEIRNPETQVAYVISGFRHEVDENRALLGCYAASIFNFLPTFRDNLSGHLQGSGIEKN